jgi:hypothetical protein
VVHLPRVTDDNPAVQIIFRGVRARPVRLVIEETEDASSAAGSQLYIDDQYVPLCMLLSRLLCSPDTQIVASWDAMLTPCLALQIPFSQLGTATIPERHAERSRPPSAGGAYQCRHFQCLHRLFVCRYAVWTNQALTCQVWNAGIN